MPDRHRAAVAAIDELVGRTMLPQLDWAWWLPVIVAALDDMPLDVANRLTYLPMQSRYAYGLHRVERSDEPRPIA